GQRRDRRFRLPQRQGFLLPVRRARPILPRQLGGHRRGGLVGEGPELGQQDHVLLGLGVLEQFDQYLRLVRGVVRQQGGGQQAAVIGAPAVAEDRTQGVQQRQP